MVMVPGPAGGPAAVGPGRTTAPLAGHPSLISEWGHGMAGPKCAARSDAQHPSRSRAAAAGPGPGALREPPRAPRAPGGKGDVEERR